jgi:hypothetical protein
VPRQLLPIDYTDLNGPGRLSAGKRVSASLSEAPLAAQGSGASLCPRPDAPHRSHKSYTYTNNSQTSFLYVIRSVLFYFHIVSAAYTFLILLSLHIVHKAKVHEARGAKYDAVCFTLDNNNKMILFGAAK